MENIANAVVEELEEGVSLDAIKMFVDAEVADAVKRLGIEDKSPEQFNEIRETLLTKVKTMNSTIIS